ncbi:hypothetical protein P261_00499 [Lachnospiraceae bacterium TWA4]|nr:hypothetical protein P261_00499 [Lachnospiraceae bacterium TWA4]
MSRKDNRGRKLKDGEYQRANGQYEFRYTDLFGKAKSKYSWRLTPTDKVPDGRRWSLSLRELETQVEKDMLNGISDTNITLDEMFDKYIRQKMKLKDSTRYGYQVIYNKYVRGGLGKKKIKAIRHTDIKSLYSEMSKKYSIGTIKNLNKILTAVFDLAILDNLISVIPTKRALQDLDCKPSKKVDSLTEREQELFFQYVKNSKYSYWYNFFVVLVGTGMRVSEIVGITWDDIDFANNEISVNHTLSYITDPETKKTGFTISTPKTENSIREIPMFNKVRRALIEIRNLQEVFEIESPQVGSYSNFVFLGENGQLLYRTTVGLKIKQIIRDYNEEEEKAAERENRTPELLPHFASHVFRHTFATRLAENVTDVKVVQSILGHADVQTTLNIYVSNNQERNHKAIKELESKIKIG